MAYVVQTFTAFQVLTAAQMNQVQTDLDFMKTIFVGTPLAGTDGTVHILKASAGAVAAPAGAILTVEDSSGGTPAGYFALNADAGYSVYGFGSPTNNFGGELLYRYSDSAMYLRTKIAGFKLVLSSGNAVTAVQLESDGAVTMPLQPSFFAHLNIAQTNVTGDATAYTVVIDTEIFDRNADFASNAFTAPFTGIYAFSGVVRLAQVDATHTNLLLELVTSNGAFICVDENPGIQIVSGQLAVAFSCAAVDMDAADTATMRVTVSGGAAGKVVDIVDGRGTTFFQGHLVA